MQRYVDGEQVEKALITLETFNRNLDALTEREKDALVALVENFMEEQDWPLDEEE